MKNNFLETYKIIVNEFIGRSEFTKIIVENSKIIWPDYSGVYVIWRKIKGEPIELIYVGMTGKFYDDNGITKFNNGTINKRALRWTPYRFCESEKDGDYKYHFKFGPKLKKTDAQAKIKYDADAYRFCIPYSELEIHCFKVDQDNENYTPTLLEAQILCYYLKSYNKLPTANNEH